MRSEMKTIDVRCALDHFVHTDPLMHSMVRQAAQADTPLLFPNAKPMSDYFPTLVRSIISQQISTKAATSIYDRLRSLCQLKPQSISQLPLCTIQSSGLTSQKAKYIHQLARNWSAIKAEEFVGMSDKAVLDRLTAQYGIGMWTAQMFLLFALARPDVFAYDDLGLRQQVVSWYKLTSEDKETILEISRQWIPHRSVASLTLWFYIDNGPVLL